MSALWLPMLVPSDHPTNGRKWTPDEIRAIQHYALCAIEGNRSLAAPTYVSAWITRESINRLLSGGNASRRTVPIHANPSNVAVVPVYINGADL